MDARSGRQLGLGNTRLEILGVRTMQKHSTHVIDEQAVHFFKGSLPPDDWTIYDIRPDYGKDHKVELVEGGEHTGLTFWVQVKGQKRVRRLRDGVISFKLETKDLDYHTRLPTPVFLVVVDVTSRVGYWVFTQEYERTRLRNLAWRSQGHIQIRLPISNLLSDTRSLREAARKAIRYMARRSLGMGIGYAQEALKTLDPRFDVRIAATAQGEIADLNALEDLQIDLKFGVDFCETGKLGDLIGRGIPVSIGPGDVTAEGSPLVGAILEETSERHGLLQLLLEGAGHVRLTHFDNEGREIGRPHEIECFFEGGLEEARFSARTSYGNLTVQGFLTSRPGTPMQFEIKPDLGCWLGRPLSSLPNFELIRDLLGDPAEGHEMRVEFFIQAMPIFSGAMLWGRAELNSNRRTAGLVEFSTQARWIATTFDIEADLPGNITAEHVGEVSKVYRIARGEEIRLKGDVASSSARLSKVNMQTLSKVVGLNGEPLRLAITSTSPHPFLGVEVDIGPVETQLSNVRLTLDREELTRKVRDGEPPILLTWEATSETELIIKKSSEESLDSTQANREGPGITE